ncbi:DUF664 domain-containing protein [uncultured Dietzia sp.]|uniref:mycothiol transferase n=1 Tax=uncultured Dietzia sp. TaxID=395519 RepID=UPI0025FCDB79|nr:DUF664 domain-containing protein [uncultured Dietzia sp.]
MVSVDPAAAAAHLVLGAELVPGIRSAIADLGGDGPGTLVHVAPTGPGSRWPSNSAAALVHHLCGVVTSWGAACLGAEEVVRDRAAEFEFAGPVGPELDRLADLVDRLPGWAAAARDRGTLAHPTGTAFDVEAARRAGTLTVDWVLAHILHDVAGHLGHLEVTRDVLLDRAPGP